MYKLKEFELKVSDISSFLNTDFYGEDITVDKIERIGHETENSIILCNKNQEDYLEDIKVKCLVFCSDTAPKTNKNLSYITDAHPEVLFFGFINEYLLQETDYWIEEVISESSTRFPDVDFGYNVKIGKNVIIAPGTKIGNNTIIGNNVVIRSNVVIGNSCIIKDNSVIGSSGFGFVKTNEGLQQIPQFGYIEIGNNVVIGSCCAIEKPAMGKTIIDNDVKIDDLVQIGQNVKIGANTVITTGFKAESGVKIGENTFIGMGVIIISGDIEIGNHCIIGAGTVVTKSVPDGHTLYNKHSNVLKQDSDEKIKKVFSNFNVIK